MNDEITNKINIGEHVGPPTITFHSTDNKEVGNLSWESGQFTFTGDADESAKVFFNFAKPLVNDYIEAEVQRRMEAKERVPGNWATEGLTEEMKKPAEWPEDNKPNPADVARREFEAEEKKVNAAKRWSK